MSLESKGKPFALAGAFLQLGWIVGIAGAFFGMHMARHALANNTASNPQELAHSINVTLICTSIGFALCFAGFVFICIAFFGSRYRGRWFFWFLIDYGVILLLAYPVGSAIGICMILFAILRRREFFIAAKNTPPNPAPSS